MNFSRLTVLLARASLSILAFCAVLSLAVAWTVTEFPYALDGIDVIEPGKIPNYFRNTFEILSFSSGPALFIAAVFAFIVASEQLQEAERTRAAEMYMGVSKEWDGLSKYREIIREFTDHIAESMKGDRIKDMVDTSEEEILPADIDKYIMANSVADSVYTILSYLEDISLLCRKRYIRIEDISDIMGSSIEKFIELFMPHITSIRSEEKSDTIYANVIWLRKQITLHHRFAVDGYGFSAA